MIVYNVTSSVSEEVFEDWFVWMRDVHIGNVMATGCFEGYKMLRMIGDKHNAEGVTYAVQYYAKDMKTMNIYASKFSPDLQEEVFKRYGEKVLSFRTLLEEV
jgi:hypothetical protein